jgi:predicted MPP superfamily phosphohydrolase
VQSGETVPILAVLLPVAGVCAAAGIVLLGMIRRRIRGGAPPGGRGRAVLRWAVLGLAAAGALCAAYARWVEPYWPEVVRLRLASPKVPRGAPPLRIVHVSDFHSDAAARLEERLPDLAAAERPDLIVFTGDAANGPEGVPVARRCLQRLAAIAPTFAVRGNWDIRPGIDPGLFEGTGARELDGAGAAVEVRGVRLWVAGVAVRHESRLAESLAGAPADAFVIFLYHYPQLVREAEARGADLMCAGHTHGGQVDLPLVGSPVTPTHFGTLEYAEGLHRVGRTWLYVSRGIGMTGGGYPRVRFGARPEVAVIEVGP